MRVLLDECTPRVVKRRLEGQDVWTVQEMGWAGIKNGDLLGRAAGRFDVLITTDQNLRHQQKLSKFDLSVIVLPSNQVPVVEALLTDIEAALTAVEPGDIIEIPFPSH
jgi:hypothetical protein